MSEYYLPTNLSVISVISLYNTYLVPPVTSRQNEINIWIALDLKAYFLEFSVNSIFIFRYEKTPERQIVPISAAPENPWIIPAFPVGA
jgi:hypothetical protein